MAQVPFEMRGTVSRDGGGGTVPVAPFTGSGAVAIPVTLRFPLPEAETAAQPIAAAPADTRTAGREAGRPAASPPPNPFAARRGGIGSWAFPGRGRSG